MFYKFFITGIKMSATQEFTFPLNVWDNIVKNLDNDSWINLMYTCKFFYYDYGMIFVKKLEIFEFIRKPEEDPIIITPWMDSLLLTANDKIVQKLFVRENLYIQTQYPLTNILPKIIKCNLIVLKIDFYNLTWNEYSLLTECGRIKHLLLNGSKIEYSNNDRVLLEDIMSQIPNAEYISIKPCNCTTETFSKLKLVERNAKIRQLQLIEMDTILKAPEVFDYCKDVFNFEYFCFLTIQFRKEMMNDNEFCIFITEMIDLAKGNWQCIFLKK
uniref:F-box domain-containing protein n=1 Tax=Panagrolaimus sp. PS1159 TaxID=55785 RepID=A0AC35GJR5_9BILA